MPMKRKSYVRNGLGPTEKEGRFCKVDPRVLFRENFLIQTLEKDTSKTTVLSKEAERELIEKYRNDRKKLNEELVLHNTRAACSIAKRYAKSTEDFNDLIARAMYGLVYAAEKFDIDSGNRFLTYATNWIFNWIQREYYARGRKIFNNTTISITQGGNIDKDGNVPPGTETDSENSLLHLIPEIDREKYINRVESTWTELELLEIVSDLVNVIDNGKDGFDELDKAIFHQKLQPGDNDVGTTFQDLSNKFNIPVQVVKKRRDQLCKRLKEYVSNKYGIRDISDIL